MGGIPEEGRHRIEVLLREWVELVVVALRAVGGQAEVDPAHGLHAVGGVVGEVLFDDRTAFVGRRVATLEAGRDALVLGRVREQVAGELLDGELVERLVTVEGLHDPVAVRPHLAVGVEVQAVRVGIAGGVEPVAGAVFAVGRKGHQFVDERGELRVAEAGAVLGQMSGQQGGRGRQAGDVEADAADERGGVGFGGRLQAGGVELGAHEPVDRVLGPVVIGSLRQRRLLRGDERPVRLPRRALLDPATHERDLGGLKLLVGFGRRHDLILVGGEHALEEGALVGLALDDGRRLFLALFVDAGGEETGFGVETQAGLAGAGVRAVAMEAVVRQEGADVAIELHLFVGREGGGDEEGQERQEGLTHGEEGHRQLKK